MSNSVKDEEIHIFVDATIFSKEVILKCLYWYGDKFHTSVNLLSSNTFEIVLKPLSSNKIPQEELELYLLKVERDLIDYSLRDIVNKETQNIRELLIAKAFANGDYEELPPGEISDPVGFNVKNI